MAQITEVPDPGRRKSPTRELIETIVLAVVITLLVRTFVVEVYRVEGSSMEATLHSGERVLVNKFLYRWVRLPQPGDVIVFRYPRQPDRDFIKRVVGVTGDRVELKAGKVYVNGRLFTEVSTVLASDQEFAEKVVPADSIWVLGDNRDNSEDSRYFGEVPLGHIRGMTFFRIWPITRMSGFDRPAALPVKQ